LAGRYRDPVLILPLIVDEHTAAPLSFSQQQYPARKNQRVTAVSSLRTPNKLGAISRQNQNRIAVATGQTFNSTESVY